MASRPDRSSSKRRRLTRACDMCKRKKSDGVEMPGNQCSNCVNSKVHCTHVDVLKNLGTAKGYVESLERRLQKLTQLFKKMLPDVDIDQELEDDDAIAEEERLAEDEQTSVFLSHAVNRTLNLGPQRQRYFGKSNALFLIQAVTAQRAHHLGKPPSLNPSFSAKQGEHWAARPWYNPRSRHPQTHYEFPEDDLLTALVDAYFDNENCILPLLHRPTFEQSIEDKQHLRDEMFASVVIMVCALGSRWVEDPRVFTDGVDMAGWPYFDQITLPPPPDGPVCLEEMQMYCLYIIYHQHIPTARTMWIYIGTAFRLLQDAGMHMRSVAPPNVHDELWKRVVWVLTFLDISYASVFGQTPTMHHETFDLDYPIECDDEYWTDGSFKQPEDRPSNITFFVQLLKLMQILSYVLRVIYAIRRPLHNFNGNRLPEPQILAGFDSALHEWQAALPDHLRWDPRRREEAFFRQSAFLHITMYYVQIQVHRPYIPGPDQKQTVMPSFAICSNAALSAMRVVESQKYRGYIEDMHLIAYLYPAAMILLLRAWSIPPGDTHPSATQEMKGVQVCLDMLKRCQKRPNNPPAFIFWDILSGLMTDDTFPRSFSPRKESRTTTTNTTKGASHGPHGYPETHDTQLHLHHDAQILQDSQLQLAPLIHGPAPVQQGRGDIFALPPTVPIYAQPQVQSYTQYPAVENPGYGHETTYPGFGVYYHEQAMSQESYEYAVPAAPQPQYGQYRDENETTTQSGGYETGTSGYGMWEAGNANNASSNNMNYLYYGASGTA